MTSMHSSTAFMVCAGIHGATMNADSFKLLERGVRSVVLFARNYENPAQVFALCKSLRAAAGDELLIAVDHEGGRVQRFRDGFTAVPSMRAIGGQQDASQAREWGVRVARELRSVGVNWNLAPVVDVDSNPANPVIGDRSFGSKPDRVAAFATAMINGLQSSGVAACAKHFPGHGDTSLDSHLDLPHLDHDRDRLEGLEFIPFRAAIGADVATVMAGHVVLDRIDPGVPASLSPIAIDSILRRHLGFNGLVTTDDVEMKAVADRHSIEEIAVKSVIAGCDLCMICHTPELQHRAIDALDHAVATGDISSTRLAESRRRFDAVIAKFS